MYRFVQFIRVFSSVRTLENVRNFDKKSLVVKTLQLAPPTPTPTHPPTTPIVPKLLMGVLFGNAARQTKDGPQEIYGTKVIPISKVRKLCTLFDLNPWMTDEEWMQNVFKKLPQHILQEVVQQWAADDKNGQVDECKFIITNGMEKAEVKEEFIPAVWISGECANDEDDLTESGTETEMNTEKENM